MTTCATLIERTRWHLQTGQYEAQNVLGAGIDSDDTTLTFTYDLGPLQAGAVISIGLELMRVWEVTTGSKTAVVQRGYAGSTAAAHTTSELATVNPRFSDFHILQALNDDLASLSGHGLYRVRTVTFTDDGSARTYNLADDVIDVLDVRYDADTSANQWPLLDNWQVLHNLPALEFASGKALRLDASGASNRDVLVRYKAPFGSLSALTDDVEAVTGLHEEAHDLPPLGAAVVLASAREIRRTDTMAQGDTRRANEVPAGMTQAAATRLAQHRQFRIGQEQGRLYQQAPLRRRRLA